MSVLDRIAARGMSATVRIVMVLLALAFAPAAQAQSSASAYTWATRYDLAGRVTGTIAPDPDASESLRFAAVRNTYDGSGFLTLVETGELVSWKAEAIAPSAWGGAFTILTKTEYTYDGLGRKLTELVKGYDSVSETFKSRRMTQYSYDAVGRVECTAVRMNLSAFGSLPSSACTLGTEGSVGEDRITKMVYDDAGQLLQIRKALGTGDEQAYASYSYTDNGKQEFVIDANGTKAKLEYDGFDRLETWKFPAKTKPSSFDDSTHASVFSTSGVVSSNDAEAYEYDANSNRTKLTKRDETEIDYEYTDRGWMKLKTIPNRTDLDSTHERDVYYTYDAQGLMTGARFDSATGEGITTEYDGFGRVTSSTIDMDSTSRELTYLYDRNSNRTRMTFPDTKYARYVYDKMDRVTLVGATATGPTRSYVYNQRGLLDSDTASTSGGTTTYGREEIGRLTSLARDVAGTSSDITTTFTYNPANQTIGEVRSNDAYAYTARTDVDLDYTTNGLNEYTVVDTKSYCHDDNGNLIYDGYFVYLYDVENRLVEKRDKVNGSCGSLSYAGTLRASLRYDPMGRLYETNGTIIGLTRYLIDGDALVAEYNSSGTLLRRYLHRTASGSDDPALWVEGSGWTTGVMRFLFADRQGSITLAGDTSGNAIRIFTYDEYGMPHTTGGTGNLTPANGARFLYTGQAWLPDLGMYYYKARIYAPQLGRFLQTDPIGYDDQMNLYAYVANDPMNGSDPSGETCEMYQAGYQVQYNCTVDAKTFEGKSKDQIRSINKTYSKIVNELTSNPNTSVSLSVEFGEGVGVSEPDSKVSQ